MPSNSPSKLKGRSPYSVGSRRSARSPMASGSPEKRHKQPLRIRMDLTETQVDRITDAFTHNINGSPMSKSHKAKPISASRSTPLGSDRALSQLEQGTRPQHRANRSVEIRSPTFAELMPRHKTDSVGLAERRRRDPPAPIHVIAARPVARTPKRPALQVVPDLVSPLSVEKLTVGMTDCESEPSMYSPEEHEYETQITSMMAAHQPYLQRQPQKPRHQGHAGTESGSSGTAFSMNDEILKMYTDWVQVQNPPGSTNRRVPEESLPYSRQPTMPTPPSPPPQPRLPLAAPRLAAPKKPDTPMFSPLPLYFRGQGFPTEKMGEKTMIGKNGWLERTRSPGKQSQTPQQQKRTGILDSIKKIAKDMSEQYHPSRRSTQPSGGEPTISKVLISLDTREQSLLYCELEFHITTALNDYITAELVKGRLVPDHLKKVSDWWHQQGRPKVIGFRYDMETQLELIKTHIHDFGFHGRRQGNVAEIAGLLHAMKVNARAMRIRTFCQPDSVIAKQLVDSQSLFNLINATDVQQAALSEVAQFFKVILEREREYRQKGALGPGKS